MRSEKNYSHQLIGVALNFPLVEARPPGNRGAFHVLGGDGPESEAKGVVLYRCGRTSIPSPGLTIPPRRTLAKIPSFGITQSPAW